MQPRRTLPATRAYSRSPSTLAISAESWGRFLITCTNTIAILRVQGGQELFRTSIVMASVQVPEDHCDDEQGADDEDRVAGGQATAVSTGRPQAEVMHKVMHTPRSFIRSNTVHKVVHTYQRHPHVPASSTRPCTHSLHIAGVHWVGWRQDQEKSQAHRPYRCDDVADGSYNRSQAKSRSLVDA